jgi:hypothetical protein
MPDDRSSCAELLNEPLIIKYKNEPNDLDFISKVIIQVKKDVVEA